MKRYTVDGVEILVSFRALKRYLWLAAGFEVRIGSRSFFPSEGVARNETWTEFEFESNGAERKGVVRLLELSSIKRESTYEVVVDGIVIANDTQPLKGYWLSLLVTGVIFVNLLLALLLSAVFVQAYLLTLSRD